MAAPCAAEMLGEVLTLCGETGRLYWKPRPENLFQTYRAYRTWNSRFVGKEALTSRNGDGYRAGSLFGKPAKAHSIVWALTHGVWPTGEIDHINGDKLDNRPENLRDVSHTENVKNRCVSNTATGHIGINKNSGSKNYRVRLSGQYFGTFSDLKTAIVVRDAKLRELGFHPNHGRPKRSAA
jgi:hypothetical protein